MGISFSLRQADLLGEYRSQCALLQRPPAGCWCVALPASSPHTHHHNLKWKSTTRQGQLKAGYTFFEISNRWVPISWLHDLWPFLNFIFSFIGWARNVQKRNARGKLGFPSETWLPGRFKAWPLYGDLTRLTHAFSFYEFLFPELGH